MQCFKPIQPPRIISGLKETFIKKYTVDMTHQAELRPKEQSKNVESCRENLRNEIQLKGTSKIRSRSQTQAKNGFTITQKFDVHCIQSIHKNPINVEGVIHRPTEICSHARLHMQSITISLQALTWRGKNKCTVCVCMCV